MGGGGGRGSGTGAGLPARGSALRGTSGPPLGVLPDVRSRPRPRGTVTFALGAHGRREALESRDRGVVRTNDLQRAPRTPAGPCAAAPDTVAQESSWRNQTRFPSSPDLDRGAARLGGRESTGQWGNTGRGPRTDAEMSRQQQCPPVAPQRAQHSVCLQAPLSVLLAPGAAVVPPMLSPEPRLGDTGRGQQSGAPAMDTLGRGRGGGDCC